MFEIVIRPVVNLILLLIINCSGAGTAQVC